ncbi:MAG: hypothetical protein FWD62_14810 [Betaproteobacteria bacterium]|nr:hypothetical protein [Betaproteobacteria bacterium]
MTLSSHGLAILALLMTSVMVRILPVFMPIRFSDEARGILERELPLAVFINFSVYIAWTEIQIDPVAAIVAIVVAAAITLTTRLGLILITVASTTVYIVTQLVLHT